MNCRDVHPCPHTLPVSCGMIATRRVARRNKRGEGAVVTFEEVVDQAIAMLQRRGRMTYRMLKRQFDLDDEALEDLRLELIKGQRLAGEEDGDVVVWIGDAAVAPSPAPVPPPPPLAYTPSYLAEKILTSRSALEGERKQVTVLFADLKGSMELLADRDPEEARQLLDPGAGTDDGGRTPLRRAP